jgi:hypothetical protein
MSKRPLGSLGDLMAKKSKTDDKIAAQNPNKGSATAHKNPFLSKPVQPEKVIANFLTQARNAARNYLPKSTTKFPITTPFCEIEARIGVLKINNKRVTPGGPKMIGNTMVQAFDVSSVPQQPSMESGITRSHYVHWTQAGLSEPSPLSSALGCVIKSPNDIPSIKHDLVETEYTETVFCGYPGDRRVCFPGLVQPQETKPVKPGQMEYKEKLQQLDLTLPAANYDFRISLASEKVVDQHVTSIPQGWSMQRVKRRRSYMRRDHNIAWQIDVTEVTSTPRDATQAKSIVFEIEMELRSYAMLQLVNEEDPKALNSYCKGLAQQLWWILGQINPMGDTVDVEEYLQDHVHSKSVQLALATCGALKKYMDGQQHGSGGGAPFQGPIASPNDVPPPSLSNIKFCGCMPVNFSRHNIEDIQQSPENGYFLSEKTDGVRHFMIFTGESVVLVDRAMRGKQPIPLKEGTDPMAPYLSLIQPGTVLDGEVVMFRGNSKQKARPIFIVFDVLCLNATEPILHLPFEQRLRHLRQATFRTKTANRDMFADAAVADPTVALPLVRKNFVKRLDLIDLLANVVEEKGMRAYRNGPVHNHLTDGIIFQPNTPYVCGTDVNLLKWKYLDTVTIDVELLPPRHTNHHNNDPDELRVGVLGEDQTMVDMTRYVKLPKSERYRLEADRVESGARIAEVGFDPEVGEWYYLTMRPDKVAPNHISTVLGTLLELSESLNTEELQYRMSVPPGSRDTYRKDVRGMLKQLLEHQKRKLAKK